MLQLQLSRKPKKIWCKIPLIPDDVLNDFLHLKKIHRTIVRQTFSPYLIMNWTLFENDLRFVTIKPLDELINLHTHAHTAKCTQTLTRTHAHTYMYTCFFNFPRGLHIWKAIFVPYFLSTLPIIQQSLYCLSSFQLSFSATSQFSRPSNRELEQSTSHPYGTDSTYTMTTALVHITTALWPT